MKAVIAFAFVVTAVCAVAVPAVPTVEELPTSILEELSKAIQSGEERGVASTVKDAIDEVSQMIVEAGYDPIDIDYKGVDYVTAVPSVFHIRSHVKDLHCSGASNIVVNDVNFSLVSLRMTLDIELPAIMCSFGDSEIDLKLLDLNLTGHLSGSFAILGSQMTATMRFRSGLVSGISLRSLEAEAHLKGIDSDLRVVVKGKDVSDKVNNVLGVQIPTSLAKHKADINELLTLSLTKIVEDAL